MYNLAEIEAQVTDTKTRQALLTVLKARLAHLRQLSECDPDQLRVIEEKIARLSEPAESSLEPEPSPGGSDSPRTDSDSPFAEPNSSPGEPDTPAAAKRFAAQLEQIDPTLRQIASDLYEHLHHRSNFARLSAGQRDAFLELLKYHSAEELAELLAKPAPIGMSLRTSKAGLNRFRDDFMGCAMRRGKIEAARVAEQ